MTQNETVVPIDKSVVSTFAKAQQIMYANHDNGSLYISNGFFIMKASHTDFAAMLEQLNERQRAISIPIVEKPMLLKHIRDDRGKFELNGDSLDYEIESGKFTSVYEDKKQYFGYNKSYVDIFNNGDNRLFVDDNAGYDPSSHNMIVKSSGGEVLGVVLPLRLSEDVYMNLAEVLPLENGWKTEYERIKDRQGVFRRQGYAFRVGNNNTRR
jgi:hypothetical protein